MGSASFSEGSALDNYSLVPERRDSKISEKVFFFFLMNFGRPPRGFELAMGALCGMKGLLNRLRGQMQAFRDDKEGGKPGLVKIGYSGIFLVKEYRL